MSTASPSAAPFPRIVAHRGTSAIAPENTLPAFALALALGAPEVEFDVWTSADGRLVVCHDPKLDRTTTGTGRISERTADYIRGVDAGVKFGKAWESVRVPFLDETMALIAGKAVMNIHVKVDGPADGVMDAIAGLARDLRVTESVYIAGARNVLDAAHRRAPEIVRCCLEGQESGATIIARAQELHCQRLQFWGSKTTDADIRRARDLGLITNYFWSDDVAEAKRLISVGVMALLTNRAERVRNEDIRGETAGG